MRYIDSLSAGPRAVIIDDPAHMTADQIARCRALLNIPPFARNLAGLARAHTDELSAMDDEAQLALSASASSAALSAPIALNSSL